MEGLITFAIYYLCFAIALGLSTTFTLFTPANRLAREIIGGYTAIDRSRLISYVSWISLVTFFFPIVVLKMLLAEDGEWIEDLALRITEFENE